MTQTSASYTSTLTQRLTQQLKDKDKIIAERNAKIEELQQLTKDLIEERDYWRREAYFQYGRNNG